FKISMHTHMSGCAKVSLAMELSKSKGVHTMKDHQIQDAGLLEKIQKMEVE
ncbi:hypothetical protein KI387_022256, partial [Taxus chinensis]